MNGEQYQELKTKLEQEYFITIKPYKYVKIETDTYGAKTYKQMSKTQFKRETSNYMLDLPNGKTEHIIKKWQEDETVPMYEEIVFDATGKKSEQVYNIYNGFRGDYLKPTEPRDFMAIKTHILNLVNNNAKHYEYVQNYLAHLIQNPGTFPRKALVFRSKRKGVGRNLFIKKFMETFLYQDTYFLTNKRKDVINRYNKNITNKLMVVCCETEDKDSFKGFTDHEIKWLIKHNQIYNETELVECFTRFIYIITDESGNKKDVYYAGEVEANDKFDYNSQYFQELNEELNDESVMYAYYQYLKNKDLSNFDIRKIN